MILIKQQLTKILNFCTITLTSTFPLHYFGSVLFKILIVDYVSLEIDKISAQPYTTLCIQFLDRENGSCVL